MYKKYACIGKCATLVARYYRDGDCILGPPVRCAVCAKWTSYWYGFNEKRHVNEIYNRYKIYDRTPLPDAP